MSDESLRSPEGILKTAPLHTLWSKAVDTEGYVKAEWMALDAIVTAGQVAREDLCRQDKLLDEIDMESAHIAELEAENAKLRKWIKGAEA